MMRYIVQVNEIYVLFCIAAANWLDPVNYPQIPVRAQATGIQLTAQGVFRNFSHIYDYVDFRLNISDFTVFDVCIVPAQDTTLFKQVSA